ncbi:MAG TPA: hypothetical protein VLD58_02560 [Gemmatimonadales bacterium]|nr:hypothetical protein [Gemmatimonadales bacterium]
MSRSLKLASAAMLAVVGLTACSDSGGPSGGKTVAFQLATRGATAPAVRGPSLLAGTETIALGNDTIVLSSVQVVLRRIELNRVAGGACDSTTTDDSCEELKAGPVLLDLPLGAGAARTFTVAIDTGSYDKLEFKIHAPETSNDAAFIAQHPDFDGVSIKVIGTYNGTPFTYTSDLDVEQEVELVPPITVTDAAGASLTLFVNLDSWFANQTNDGLINPDSANKGGAAEGEVKSNIETSLNAFEDANHDGEDDHGIN